MIQAVRERLRTLPVKSRRRRVLRALRHLAVSLREYADPSRARMRWLTGRVVRKHGLADWHRPTPWERPYLVSTADRIARDLPASSLVLDCGCGLGHLFFLLHRRGFRRFRGIDRDPRMAAAAAELLAAFDVRAQIDVGDAFELLRQTGPVDVFVTTNWHHAVRGALPRLAEAAGRIVGPGGLWLFDALGDPPPPLAVEAPHGDREGFSAGEVDQLVQSVGLRLLAREEFADRALYVAFRS